MTTAACIQRPLEASFLERRVGDADETAACLAAIDEAMRSAERETTWPRFINVLRTRGPAIRERMLELVALVADHDSGEPRPRRRSLVARLADAGLDEDQRGLVSHARRMIGGARGVWYLLNEQGFDHAPLTPEASKHAIEGEKAAWMYTFAIALLCRVASGEASAEQPSTEFAITLAVDSGRDANAHWATALELSAEDEDA
jgi:hypothetical protein